MRLGFKAESLSDWLRLRSRRFPRPLFDVMGTMILSRTVMAGVHFGLFDRLAAGPKTATALAAETGCDEHGMELLLNALVSCGYLKRVDGGYRNAPLGQQWLVSGSSPTLANFVRYNYEQWEWVSHLEEYVQHGEARDIHQKLDEQGWRSYLLGLRDLATLSAEELIAQLALPSPPQSLLDIGAGHCYYAITLCRHYPSLRTTVVDLEPSTRMGRELVAQAGLAGRFDFRVGSLTETPFGESHNLAFLFNVMHHLDEPTNRACLLRLYDALAAGGRLVVWESFREEQARQEKDQLGNLLGLFFGLVSRRQSYEFRQVAEWTRAAGFQKIRRQTLRSAPFAALLVATK